VPDVRTGEDKDRHGDVAIALLMAWFASIMDAAEYRYIPVLPLKTGDDDNRQRTIRTTAGFAHSKRSW
jgi:phage FluMu gp28-like protein